VRRLWLPRVRRRRDGNGGQDDGSWLGGSGFDVGGDDLGGAIVGIVIAVVFVVVLALIVIFVLPYVFFVFELALVPLVVLYKIVFRRPFTIEATMQRNRHTKRRWKVIGWRASGEAVEEVARAFEQGREPLVDARALVSAS